MTPSPVLVACAALAAGGCASRPTFRDETPRAWLEVSTSVVEAHDVGVQLAGDGETLDGTGERVGALGIVGGYDFAKGAIDTAVELGLVGWHGGLESDSPLVDDLTTPDSESFLVLAGLRATWDPTPPLSLYVRGGVCHASEHFDDADLADRSGFGGYVGLGIDWRFEKQARLGPFVLYHAADDGTRESWLLGIALRFHLGER